MDEVLVLQAKKRAMHLLERMDRTEAQLREKLRQSHFQDEVIEEAIIYVKSFHYIDDYRYACNYVRNRELNNSRRKLTTELMQKGVEAGLINRALEEEYRDDKEEEKILKWLEKKQYHAEQADPRQRQRIYQFLLRKGFHSEDILRNI